MTIKKFLVLLCLCLLLFPQGVWAKAGGGGSFGSRGTNTYRAMPPSSPYQAAPMQRSVTPPPTSSAPRMQPQMAPAFTPSAPSFFGNHPILGGLVGGFLGAGLFHSLFGGGMGGYGYGGGGGGGLLSLLLIGVLIFFAVRLFRQSGGWTRGVSSFSEPQALQQDAPFLPPQPVQAVETTALTIGDSDYQAFRDLLEKIQMHWGQADLTHLRQVLTPEMLGYFGENLSANSSRGLMNKVEQVKVLAMDLIESWSEYDMDYATLHMKWDAIDYMVRLDRDSTETDYVAEGSRTTAVSAEEIWTFTRAHNGGRWLLSAIQQVK